MPTHKGSDANGPYWQWGYRKKYYYKEGDSESEKIAYEKAERQGRAIHARGWHE